ncbi:MAG: hypothetical protein J0L67_19940 [Cytophagales bacterium]|nr:hypothetical protein [Cytophagales bacterium]
MIKVTEYEATVDTTHAFFEWLFDGRKKGGIYHNISRVRLSSETHQIIKGILTDIPSKMSVYDQSVGCPDCADGCGIYLQVSDKHWLIDPKEYDDGELSEFIKLVWSYDSIVRQEIFNVR